MSAAGIGDAFLRHHLDFHPVDATFMGLREYDHRLPRADREAAADERRGIAALRRQLAEAPQDGIGARLDSRIASGELDCAEAALDVRPRWHNPAWFTGEAAFSIIGLLLPRAAPHDADATLARLAALPDFLSDGRARLLQAGAAPGRWVARAAREAAAMAGFLTGAAASHPAWRVEWRARAEAAAAALRDFADGLDALADREAAAGGALLARITSRLHGLRETPEALAAAAQAAFDRLGAEIEADAAALAPGRSVQQILDGLAQPSAAADALPARYRHWHEAAMRAAHGLVTPEPAYGLSFRPLAAPFLDVAGALYFLSYRSPPAAAAGEGSVYWLPPAGAAASPGQDDATIKLIHAVHHGSIGHHTHNAHARRAESVLGRVAGTDCASGIALLSGGMAVEGWACHAEDLLIEAPGFYTPEECLLLKQYERRNAASVLVDVRLHAGHWSEREAMRFYRDEAGFAPQRVEAEVVRNSMFPGSRLMYWAGVEAIRALRRRRRGSTAAFHDALLCYGHVPLDAIELEMVRSGTIE